MPDPALWFPGARLNQLAPVDGGSILGGQPKCLHHDTETTGFPSYSTGFFPNMTGNPITGEVRQHIPANRAARALRNESGGVQTNRLNVFQIEWLGFANKVPFHPVMREVALWLREVRGTPLECTVDWLPYDASFGNTRVRLSGAEWNSYAGHLGHMHAPENAHGDPGWPFPIDKIIAGEEADDMYDEAAEKRLQDFIAKTVKAEVDRTYNLAADGAGGGQAHADQSIVGVGEQVKEHCDGLYRLLARGGDPVPPPDDIHYRDSVRHAVELLEALAAPPEPLPEVEGEPFVLDSAAVATALAGDAGFLAAVAKAVNDDAARRQAE